VGAGGAAAELPLERCCIDGRGAQKWWRICFGAYWVHEAPQTLSSSLALRHHDQMQADAVSQRAAWVLVPRPLNCRLSDAVSMGGGRKNGGASVSGAYWVHEAPETISSCLALQHHDQMQADAVSQRAARVLVPRPLTYHVSDAVSMHVARRNGGASVSGAVGVPAHTALAGFFSGQSLCPNSRKTLRQLHGLCCMCRCSMELRSIVHARGIELQSAPHLHDARPWCVHTGRSPALFQRTVIVLDLSHSRQHQQRELCR
jgi:hypothetical protein